MNATAPAVYVGTYHKYTRMDGGQASRLGIRYFPALMLADPKSGTVKPVSYGFISQDDLAKQFLNVSTDFAPNF